MVVWQNTFEFLKKAPLVGEQCQQMDACMQAIGGIVSGQLKVIEEQEFDRLAMFAELIEKFGGHEHVALLLKKNYDPEMVGKLTADGDSKKKDGKTKVVK